MSWSEYISALVNSNKINHAAIIGYDDKNIYGKTDQFNLGNSKRKIETDKGTVEIDVNELETVFEIFRKNGAVKFPPGIWINGTRYHMIKYLEESKSAYLKCVDGGATVIKTNKLIQRKRTKIISLI